MIIDHILSKEILRYNLLLLDVFSRVCYLNNHEKDFRGGLFRFKDGQPSSVIPIAGDVLIYTADDRNIHAVDEVVDGERLTLTLWFTRNPAHDEDSKLTSFLSRWLLEHERGKTNSFLPLPGSDNMYWFSDGKLGFEIRCARAQNLGFKFYRLKHQEFCDADLEDDPLEQLSKPVRIGRSDEIFDMEFVNSLHALQVLLFYHLKAHELMASREKNGCEKESTKLALLDAKDVFELKLPCDHQLAERILCCLPYVAVTWHFCWDDFVLAVSKWEEYMSSLHEELLMLIPQWVDHQTIFNVGTLE
ncbi:hypothetical protein HPP92_016714 [Vanilla planifolia]|uniref:Prolyl 4-hydroxylase alpha subunit Fe(2+) 2OG dioxygenase domain-containing protein n=1 Tax=Vanilla planifolia TaxID=51239 RepID=A0A835QCR3_VANPL|nr:hypothetical protein HPP92_016714 [Vanilla planifolia]